MNATGSSPASVLSVVKAAWMRHIGRLIGGRTVGVSIRAKGRVLYERGATSPFAPASNEKLMLSMALLDHMGTGHRIDTVAAAGPVRHGVIRGNLWILGHYGIESSVFPSGHVAAVTAVCLSIRRHWPSGGVPFVIAAASVAVATIIGRYHYAADALAGAFIGSMAFLISKAVHQT